MIVVGPWRVLKGFMGRGFQIMYVQVHTYIYILATDKEAEAQARIR
jgi:hypothetical protein